MLLECEFSAKLTASAGFMARAHVRAKKKMKNN